MNLSWGKEKPSPQERRAKRLLESHLNVSQRWTLNNKEYITVRGSDGRRYRIYREYKRNVAVWLPWVGWRRELWVDCLEPTGRMSSSHVPLDDRMLAQKMFLEVDAIGFRNLSC